MDKDDAVQDWMCSTFEGTALLELPNSDQPSIAVRLQFNARRLEFQVTWSGANKSIRLAQAFSSDGSAKLTDVSLGTPFFKQTLQATAIPIHLKQLPWATCEISNVSQMDFTLSGEQVVTFFSGEQFKTPYIAYYQGACSLGAPFSLTWIGWDGELKMNQRGDTFCMFAHTDFFAHEKRLHAGLMLIHGRSMERLAAVRGKSVTFYGRRSGSQRNYLPLADDMPSVRQPEDQVPYALMRAVWLGLLALEEAQFLHLYLAVKFFIAGKQADVSLEFQYLLLMTCVEAMDESRQLKDECTAAMLGVSLGAARLVNGMRNKLVHGNGSYRHAFEKILEEDVEWSALGLEAELADCLIDEAELDFVKLWLRLCERLDAFWCAYLNVPEALVAQRYARVSLMSPVDKGALRGLSTSPPLQRRESGHIDALREVNRKLQEKNAELRATIRGQGQVIARLKQGQ